MAIVLMEGKMASHTTLVRCFVRIGLLFVLIAALFFLAACEEPDSLLVKLDDGTVQGEMAGESRLFLKIPYAKPPVGDLRWKAPEPNEPWAPLVRHETEFADNCPQLEDQGSPGSTNEDCLYVNVWSPEPPPEKAPVMVWIHGGGNFSGGAGIPIPMISRDLWYDGQYFASNNGVVVVTFNYRLGPMGFMAHPDLEAEDSPLGNQGLLDQRRVLEWVQDNIEQFGGDPDNVTLFGESAGSADVCYHVTSPGSRGLFHRAVSQSGGCTLPGERSPRFAGDVASGMTAFGEAVGCEDTENQLDCMRDVPIEVILEHSNQPSPGDGDTSFSEGDWSFRVVIDGDGGVLPDEPRAMFKRGDIAKVPYLLGANNDEGTTFVWRATRLWTDEAYMADLRARFGDFADEVYAMYPPSDFGGNYNRARENVITDSDMLTSTHDTARLASDAGLDVFMYNFNVPWSLLPTVMKAAHASEISHVFGKPYVRPFQNNEITEESQKVADAMNTYWASFARNGNPNFEGSPALWPRFLTEMDKRLQLDSNWEILTNYKARKCAFWREYYDVE